MRPQTKVTGWSAVPEDTAPPTPHVALDTLRPMAAVASATMVGFVFYNLVDFPPGIRGIMVAHDLVSAGACGLVWWMIRAGRIREERAHAVASFMILLVASNILLAMWLVHEAYLAFYICVVLVGAGAGMTSVRWGAVNVAMLWAATVPVLVSVADAAVVARYLAMMAATSTVMLALIVIRVRNVRALERLTALDREQRRALKDAVADLDAKVLLRTAELQRANASLRTQMEERERAEGEARQLGEQLLHAQRLESLGRLAGGIAHDFNNLLTVIEGNLRLAIDDLPIGQDREPLEDAIGAAERAGQLTKQLLAIGRKQVIERSVFDVGKQVEDIARILQRVLGETIDLHVVAEERDLWVDADPNQIEQVLMNLTVNARDAMPERGACHVEVGRVEVAGARFVRIRFRDTGVGMDTETRKRLFEPFFTTKAPGKGTGLGLSTAYGIVEQHGGMIKVDSILGVGTTFDVLLPAVGGPTRVEAGVPVHEAQAGGTETVLLVEDEDAVRRVAERFLRRHGYEVLVASGGAEALEVAARSVRRLDLLFTDVMMPGMNGRELAERLRALQPDLKVLFVSGYSGDYLETQTGELPERTHFLYKPYEPSRAAGMIRDILDDRVVEPR